MEIETIFGSLFSGFATKIGAVGAALWITIESSSAFAGAMESVSNAFALIN